MAVDHSSYDPVARFGDWLLTNAPELRLRVDQARAECGAPSSAYWFLSFVVRRHMEDLAARGDSRNLERFWSLLEQVAQSGSASEREDLFSTLEEFDLKEHLRWLGPALKALTAEL
jgi:hypothetical protein